CRRHARRAGTPRTRVAALLAWPPSVVLGLLRPLIESGGASVLTAAQSGRGVAAVAAVSVGMATGPTDIPERRDQRQAPKKAIATATAAPTVKRRATSPSASSVPAPV